MKRVDLTNRRFGRLTVVSYNGYRSGKTLWLCRCDCGNTRVVSGSNLRRGNTRSCGCLATEVQRATGKRRAGVYEDLCGRRFGQLTVLAMDGLRKGKPFWLCRCDCGAEKVIMGQSLRSGGTQSCGCMHIERCRKPRKAIVGQRFGRLVVSRYLRDGEWESVCDCGNRVITNSSALRSGHTQSCGCYRLERVRESVTTHGLSYTPEYLRVKTRERLERKRHLDCRWTLLMERCLREQQPACVVCGATYNLATDHVRPLSKGYGLQPGNAVTLCCSCNSRKHAKDLSALPDDWQTKIAVAARAFKQYWDEQSRPLAEANCLTEEFP